MGEGRGNGRNPFQVQETPTSQNNDRPGISFPDVMRDAPRQEPRPAQAAQPLPEAFQAEQIAGQVFQQYSTLSENGTKPVSAELFKTISSRFDAALSAANTLTPQALQNIEGQAALTLAQQIPDANKQRDSLARYQVVQTDLATALQGLTPAQAQKAQAIEEQFKKDAGQAQTTFAGNPAGMQAEVQRLVTKMFADQKANSPALGNALEAQMTFMNTIEGQAAGNFMGTMQAVESLRHSPATIKFLYAQVLDKQGGEENKAKAKLLLGDAIKDSQVANFIDGSPEAQQLALKLDAKTPNMVASLAQVQSKFPELVETQKAMDLLAEPGKDKKVQFAAAREHFEKALAMTDREGPDAIKIEDLGKRMQELDAKIKAAGAKPDPKDQSELQDLNLKAQNIGMVRYQYALALNQYGHDQNDEASKTKAVQLLQELRTVAPNAYNTPDVAGALLQANSGRRIDPVAAVSEALTDNASTRIRANSQGLLDTFLPGVTPGLGVATRPFGVTPSDLPFAGPVMFGDHKKNDEQLINQLAQSYLNNADATQSRIDKEVNHNRSALREFGSDAAAIGAGFGTRYLTQGLMQGPWYAKAAGLALQFGAAGVTKDYLADGELGTGRDWLRGTGMYGLGLATYKTLSYNPSRISLTPETAGSISSRYGVTGFANSAEVTAALEAQRGGILARAGNYLNPLNYSGFKPGAGFIGFGGERTAQALGNGLISVAEFNARRSIGTFGNYFAAGYMLNAGRTGLYIGTGDTKADGSQYTPGEALWAINGAGFQGGMTSALVMPFASGFVKGIPGIGQGINGSSRVLARISPVAPAIAGDAIYFGAPAGLGALSDYHQAQRLEDLSAQARKLATEAQDRARQQVGAR